MLGKQSTMSPTLDAFNHAWTINKECDDDGNHAQTSSLTCSHSQYNRVAFYP
ncbi:hypothetical protein GYH30_029091 [Glycine max]|nr:hypothetical protein GYH30_029091 [Glycine max]